jgi:hypothetical protein
VSLKWKRLRWSTPQRIDKLIFEQFQDKFWKMANIVATDFIASNYMVRVSPKVYLRR